MAVQLLTYDDKSFLNENPSIADVNKVNDTDMNEIKSVVNNNANELNNLMPTTLYTNENGSAGSLTLNDNISNYSFYEIIYSREKQAYSSLRMPTNFTTNITLSVFHYLSNISRIYFSNINISGTSLTRNYSRYINIIATGTNDTVNQGESDTIYIHKIIGYK